MPPEDDARPPQGPVPVGSIAREWTRIGVTGFGGPPAHIALLRRVVVEDRGWMAAAEFEDANAACSMLPGPASTQLAILCAYRVGGVAGAVAGGLGFIVPAVVLILILSALFLGSAPPLWIRGAGAGAGAAVAAVAVHAGRLLVGPSLARARQRPGALWRWGVYVAAGAAGAVLVGSYLVLVLLACGGAEMAASRGPRLSAVAAGVPAAARAAIARAAMATGPAGGIAWMAFKVGALSFGGGFVIVPLMQGDAVRVHHWMSNAQFLNAVALGQVTPGPVVATVAAVGYVADGVPGGLLAALVAFLPSFFFILAGARQFRELRASPAARRFLDGAAPAAVGAIFGAAIVLAAALSEPWQAAVLAGAAVFLLVLRRGVVATLVLAGAAGVVLALAGAPVPGG